MTFRRLDHTADLRLEIEAADRDALFAEALRAFTECLTPIAGVRPTTARRFRLAAPDDERLLVEWLEELLAAFEVDGLLFAEAVVAVRSGDRISRLDALARGEPFDPERHPLDTVVKATTYHGLEITSGPGGWRATVVLDV